MPFVRETHPPPTAYPRRDTRRRMIYRTLIAANVVQNFRE